MRLPCLLALFLATVSSYKILVYNMKFGHSHSNFLGRIADILVEEGHDVTSLIPVVDPTVADGTTKSRVIHVPTNNRTKEMMDTMHTGTQIDFWEEDTSGPYAYAMFGYVFTKLFCPQCESTLAHPGLLEELTEAKYDVFINENFDFCGMGLFHAIGAKASIMVSTTTLFDNVAYQLGIPVVPSINPAFGSDDFDINSIWSRAMNAIRTNSNHLMWGPALKCANEIYRNKFGEGYPDIDDLTANSAFVLTNSEPFIDFARPLLRKVIDLGGLGVKQPKPIDEHWNKVLSLRDKNVLVSFGSMAKSSLMNMERKQAMLKMFSAFPDVTFIWKYEKDDDFTKNEVPNIPNVIITKWMPQNDLLNDPRMTAFVSHAGMGSCQEAASRGVPGLFIPLYGDQPRNAAMMAANGIGLKMRKWDARDAQKLTAAVNELIFSERLHKNAKRISAMLAKRPFSPRELLVKHIEFAAEFGPSEALKPRGIKLGYIQYFLFDVIAIASLSIITAVSIFIYCAYRLIRIFVVPSSSAPENLFRC